MERMDAEMRSQMEAIIGEIHEDDSPERILHRFMAERSSSTAARVAVIDKLFIPFLQAARAMPIDPTSFASYIPPQTYDIMLSDIHTEDLPEMATDINVAYLGDAPTAFAFPAKGLIYGFHMRMIIALPVAKRGLCIWVPFILDTGSPFTYLSADVLTALGYTENIHKNVDISIGGVPASAGLSHSHFACVSVLSQSFLMRNHAQLTVNYRDGQFTIVI